MVNYRKGKSGMVSTDDIIKLMSWKNISYLEAKKILEQEEKEKETEDDE